MGDKNFRLPTTVRPERYRFRIEPDIASATFVGEGRIELTTDEPRRDLVVHGVFLDVTRATIDGRSTKVSSDGDSQTLTFALDGDALPAGRHTVEIAWRGQLHKDLRGFYLAGPMAVTQFEAADARRCFPCFDEPAFKATWELTLDVPAGMAAISNGRPIGEDTLEGGKRRVRFQPTPRMSSYLVAMIVGPLVPSEPRKIRHVESRTWATAEKAHLAGWAQDCAAAVLPLLEDYFGVPYAFGDKLDQVGVPNFEAGAMENSACITYREAALLIDPKEAPLSLQKRVAEIVTHELAHQWFGNLVTMQWWDDLWLNEAFATWMAFKTVAAWKPGWRMWDDFSTHKAAALRLDALESTHPIRGEVKNADQATESFDLITYEKGGGMLRMIEGYLGEERFRDGIRDYMRQHAWKNTVADDLWRALGKASGAPVERLANDWIGRPGFPLVTVTRRGQHVRLEQRRFFADPDKLKSASEAPWLVPLVLRFADDEGPKELRVLLDAEAHSLTLPTTGDVRYLCANAQGAGFYRVSYAPEEIAALSRHRAQLAPIERMGILSDAAALFAAGAGPLASLLDGLCGFAADTDYAVLADVVAGFDLVDRRFAAEKERPALRALVEKLLRPQLAELGWEAAADEPDAVRLRRAAAVRGLALVARAGDVVEELARRIERVWAGDRAALEPNLLDVATVAAARAGDAKRFARVEERARTVTDPAEKRRALVALASFEAPSLVDKSVEMALADVVLVQDMSIYFGTLLGNEATRDRAFDLMHGRWDEVRRKLSPWILRSTVEGLRELVHRRGEVERFLTERAGDMTTAVAAVSQTRERLRLDEEARRRAEPELAAWLAQTGSRR